MLFTRRYPTCLPHRYGTPKRHARLRRTPAELTADIIDNGMALVGGGALLHEINTLPTEESGIPAYVADNPKACTGLGVGKVLNELPILPWSMLNL